MDAQNLLGVVNHGSPRLRLNDLARELFWFVLERRIVMTVEWVPRELNTLADDLSKLIIPDDWMIQRTLFPAAGAALGAASGGLVCVKREQPVRAFLFAALVPRDGGSKRLRVPLGHKPTMGERALPVIGARVAQVAS